ncbi:PEP-CTERM sorting domain-containing protein [Rubritalea profundi]|uniref:Ice-binding protein C-terminal domain-containing protein n=1 Tax=Rubritalea profundi TaxID=1658618 RepID=A0A2S7U5B2_9BACT|nr:PEP-CTERM sorting domain-containing protein [Rubritalea profundi]PQJ30188.1 hypothetical protein BSZ32_18060 [Rubritalea profundi]
MNKNLIITLGITCVSLALPQKSEAATLNFSLGQMWDSSNVLIPENTVGILVADITGSGFGSMETDLFNFDLNSTIDVTGGGSQTLIGTDFEVLSILSADSNNAFLTRSVSGIAYDDGLGAGDNLAFIWLPGLTSTGDSITGGQSFGLITGLTGAQNGSGTDDFIIPGSPSDTVTFSFFSTNIGGGLVPIVDFTADLNIAAIPEPTSIALLGLGSVALLLRRRR